MVEMSKSQSISMRDSFFNKLYEIASSDRDVIIVSADMGAPSLDKYRSDLAEQFVNVGIAEINMVTVAVGLALSGKRVFIYAIMPFTTLRCYEALKVNVALMNIPITIVGIGAGFSYDDSGPTHHATEEICIMRALPDITIFNSTDSVMAGKLAEIAYKLPGYSYIRLDRELLPVLYDQDEDFSAGLSEHAAGSDLQIIATGNMVHKALEISKALAERSISAGVTDLYRIKPINKELLVNLAGRAGRVVTIEEHFLDGGMGSAVLEVLADNNTNVPVKRFGVSNNYFYAYGGRINIQSLCGLDMDHITETITEWCG